MLVSRWLATPVIFRLSVKSTMTTDTCPRMCNSTLHGAAEKSRESDGGEHLEQRTDVDGE